MPLLEKGAAGLADTTKNFKTPRGVNVIIKTDRKNSVFCTVPLVLNSILGQSSPLRKSE